MRNIYGSIIQVLYFISRWSKRSGKTSIPKRNSKAYAHLFRILFVFCVVLSCMDVYGAIKTFTGPGNFGDASKWNNSSLPGSGDVLRINGICTIDNNGATDNVAYGTLDVGRSSAGSLVWPAGGTNRLKVTDICATTSGSSVNMTNGGTLIVSGTWTLTNITYTPGQGTIEIKTAMTLPAASYNNLIINSSGTISTAASSLTVNNLTLTTGTFTAPATLTINGNFVATGGTIVAGAQINIAGNWTKASGSIFTQGTGTVTFNGSADQVLNGTSAGRAIYNVVIAKSGGNVSTGGSTTIINANNLTMTSGELVAPSAINLNGNIYSTGGTFTPGTGAVNLNGSSQQSVAIPIFYNLNVANTTGAILSGNIAITNNLNLSSGSLTLSVYNLTLGSSATITGASATKYIVTNNNPVLGGFLIQRVSGSQLFPVGTSNYTPVTVNNTGTADDFRVRVFNGLLISGISGLPILDGVNKTWLVEENVAGGSNVTLTMQWNAADESLSFDRSNCGVIHYTGGLWDAPGSYSAAAGTGPYSISRSGISSFSPFGVGDDLIPLPVKLLTFSAEYKNKLVELNWVTGTEINSSHFNVEHSSDGKNFDFIGRVEGSGNSNSLISYQFVHLEPLPGPGSGYYRLKQVDYDGTTSYSAIEHVQTPQSVTIGALYPMPAQENVNIPVEPATAGNYSVEIYNTSGRLLYSEPFCLDASSRILTIPTAGLPQGAYVVQLKNNGETHSMKLLK